MGAETVSVIIPSFNSASMLPDAIGSVLGQSRGADEIIVVDDGSSDGTAEVCAKYAPQVRYIRQPNSRASIARNRGVNAATGEWIAFLDADDVWEREKLALQLTALAKDPSADFCVSAVLAWDDANQRYHRYAWEGSLDAREMQRELLIRNILSGICSSIVVRKSALLAIGGFAPDKGSEDRRLAVDLLHRHKPLLLPEALVRQRPGPAHWSNPERQRIEMIQFIEDYDALYRRFDPSGRLKRRAYARMHERTGMHYLENGQLRIAAFELARAAMLWPFMPNPWRVLVNFVLGRLSSPRNTMQSPTASQH